MQFQVNNWISLKLSLEQLVNASNEVFVSHVLYFPLCNKSCNIISFDFLVFFVKLFFDNILFLSFLLKA